MHRTSIKAAMAVGLVVIVLLMTATIAGCGEEAKNETVPAATQSIPQLAGLTEAQARAALEAAGWAFQVEYLPVPADQVGVVLSQQPASGELAGEEQLVLLVVGTQQLENPAEVSGGSSDDTPSDSGSGNDSPQDSTPESTWATCPFCGGTGKVNGTTCGVCLGTGQVR